MIVLVTLSDIDPDYPTIKEVRQYRRIKPFDGLKDHLREQLDAIMEKYDLSHDQLIEAMKVAETTKDDPNDYRNVWCEAPESWVDDLTERYPKAVGKTFS